MKHTLDQLSNHPNELARHYSHFRVDERLLLTGHSHQAWPDVARLGMEQAWADAAALVDDKWGPAFMKAQAVRDGYARLIDDENGHIVLAPNTHDLLLRFLSALPWSKKKKIIMTDGEFHTARRQLTRLEEEGVVIIRIPSYPVDQVAWRIIESLDDQTAAVIVSAVFYETGLIVPGLDLIAKACLEKNIELLIDAYHAVNVIPFSVKQLGLQQAFIVGGGYKYCQLGEGNCFMRFPADCQLRPIITGWFSEFSLLAKKNSGNTSYGQGPDLFAGSTYDPVSHYRAAEVFRFFEEHELSPAFLRDVSQHQIGLMTDTFLEFDLPEEIITVDSSVSLADRAGFLVFITDFAGRIHDKLKLAGVLTDYRGKSLRFGPAPYLSDSQLKNAIGILNEVVKTGQY
ncbi:MAG: aminotransferase class V-fold PLP-dependent enzyme [Bacteroidales bacterium]|nr:aminotransferase class V-fold PLP-dependent enzyme [Bacteroidales bacterium]